MTIPLKIHHLSHTTRKPAYQSFRRIYIKCKATPIETSINQILTDVGWKPMHRRFVAYTIFAKHRVGECSNFRRWAWAV